MNLKMLGTAPDFKAKGDVKPFAGFKKVAKGKEKMGKPFGRK